MVFHPIICCRLSTDLAALAYGKLSNCGLNLVLGYYFTKASSNPGAGDLLMGFLGSIILAFAFSMFRQRKYKKGDKRIILLSKHLYHTGCGSRWLSINKACPNCYKEFSVFEMESAAGQSDGGDSGTVRWPRQETFTLLDIRSRLDSRFKEANQKGLWWEEVSRWRHGVRKQRELWTEEKHKKFIEALKLYGQAWRRI